MSGNYTWNELSHAVKLRAAVLGVTDIACARNSHFNIPTLDIGGAAVAFTKLYGPI